MCKNKNQFQEGLSLQGFLSQFGSEDQCRNAIVRWRWPQDFVCPSCGHTKYCLLKTRDLFQCNRCRAQISTTAGTIFDSTKLLLTTWFLSIYLITQSKVSVSALSLKRTIGVSYNTALLVKHKIQQVMKERDDSKPLDTEYIQVDDAYWGGKKHFPRYLAEFCYRFNRRFDLKQMIARFGYIAVRTTPAPQRLLKVAELCG